MTEPRMDVSTVCARRRGLAKTNKRAAKQLVNLRITASKENG